MKAAQDLSYPIQRLFTVGDVAGMRARLLHSSIWQQHGKTSFGDEQITAHWMRWLAACGTGICAQTNSAENNRESVQILTLTQAGRATPVRLAVWYWHNGEHIKRALCIPDTEMMAAALSTDYSEITQRLPPPDPLVIADYDQQRHPLSVEVLPSQLADLPSAIKPAFDAWWSLWQDGQLAATEQAYLPAAKIFLPGKVEPGLPEALVNYSAHMFHNLRRRYCVPESVIWNPQSPDKLAVLWHMEGDAHNNAKDPSARSRRIRVTVINFLEFSQKRIAREVMLVDQSVLAKSAQTQQ